MTARSIRYQIYIIRNDGSREMIEANSRRPAAVKRATFVAGDRAGWPSVVCCYVRDTMDWRSNYVTSIIRY